MHIRPATHEDLEAMKSMYADTIRNVCRDEYNPEQLTVWAANAHNATRWQHIIRTQHVLVAEQNDTLTGFCSITTDGYIDLMFVHKDYQRKGIAELLYRELEAWALQLGIARLNADVSKTAKPFFERMGFAILQEQEVWLQGVMLLNYKMYKRIE
jgi:putative acetyltransferase